MVKIEKKDLTQEILKEYLSYNPLTGIFTWIKKLSKKTVIGSRAGSISKRDNKRVLRFFGCLYMEHRLAWLYMTGNHPKNHIDHINHNELDNCFCNLRDISQQENNKNLSKRSDNTSGITGIWVKKSNKYKKYIAELHVDNVRVFYKAFLTLDEAIKARKEQEYLHGFHKNHGISKP